jgi:hypothetical protein
MHEVCAASRSGCRKQSLDFANIDIHTVQALRQGAVATSNQHLLQTGAGQATNQQFRLSLSTPVTAGEINVCYLRSHKT